MNDKSYGKLNKRKLIRFHGDMEFNAPDIDIVQVVNNQDWKMIQLAFDTNLEFGDCGETNVIGQKVDTTWRLDDNEVTVLSTDEKEIELFLKWFESGFTGLFDFIEVVRAEMEKRIEQDGL